MQPTTLQYIQSSWIIEPFWGNPDHSLRLPSGIKHASLLTVVTVKSGACEQLKSSSSIVSSSSASLADETLFFLACGDSSGISWSPSCSPSLSDCSRRFRAISYSASNINIKNLDVLQYKHYKNLLVQNTDLSGKTNTFLWTKYKLKCKFKTQIKICVQLTSSKWRQ